MVEDLQLHGLAVGGEVVVGLADVLVDVLRKRGDIGFVGGKLRQGDVETPDFVNAPPKLKMVF